MRLLFESTQLSDDELWDELVRITRLAYVSRAPLFLSPEQEQYSWDLAGSWVDLVLEWKARTGTYPPEIEDCVGENSGKPAHEIKPYTRDEFRAKYLTSSRTPPSPTAAPPADAS